jgi:hypothetical protein
MLWRRLDSYQGIALAVPANPDILHGFSRGRAVTAQRLKPVHSINFFRMPEGMP